MRKQVLQAAVRPNSGRSGDGTRPLILVGQTPPPVHGQALAIARLVDANFAHVDVLHARMSFSNTMGDIGRFRLRKLGSLASLISIVLRIRKTSGAEVLYYPPAGPALIPVLRDIAFLTAIRPFFKAVILDFHAGGLDSIEPRLPALLRVLFRKAFHGVHMVVEKYPSPASGIAASARHRRVVPYGVEDEYAKTPHDVVASDDVASDELVILYVGLITPSKGVLTILNAVALLRKRGFSVRAVLVGEPSSATVAKDIQHVLDEHGLQEHVHLTGRLTGDRKWQAFSSADVFCFPSYYENEALPIAIIEAMQFKLPVVGSNWRGIPELVHDGETGFLVPPRDVTALADRLQLLISDRQLRRRMGESARRIFTERHTAEAYLHAMEDAFETVLRDVEERT